MKKRHRAENVFYLEEESRWQYLVDNAGADDIAVKIDKAMKSIEEKNPPLKGALPSNLYATLGASKSSIKNLIDEINKVNAERFHEEDIIGRVYEYFLQIYAASGTKDDGEFYTPACIVKLIAELIEPFSGVVYQYLVDNAGADDIAVKIDKAMKSIEEKNPPLKGALPSNLYATLGASKSSIKNLIDEINKVNAERFHEEDIIGRVYEYFLQIYAASGTKDDGEFYTPACIVKLIAELIEPFSGVVYDPCCGSGGMFVQSLRFVDSHNGNSKNISVIGQESKLDTWKLCKMNLAIRGIAHDLGSMNASTFTNDLHKDRKVNFIMANPPFNLSNWRGTDELKDDPRFKIEKFDDSGKANGSVTPPVSNANYAWILHMISKLDVNNGIAGFLLANGALTVDGDEMEIRKSLIENDKVEAIIILPRNMFYTVDLSATLWIINNNKNARELNGRKLRDRRGEVLFVDLRQFNKNIATYVIDKKSSKKKTILTDEQIEQIRKMYHGWQSADISEYEDIPELCKSATKEQIREKGYSLAPSKYIEFIDHDLEIEYDTEMKRIQKEMQELIKREKDSQKMLSDAFRGIGYGID